MNDVYIYFCCNGLSYDAGVGSQAIHEDGKEITSTINLLQTDFGHSWNSENSMHIFRIEASLGVTSEHTYMFLIDGQRFVDMPRKPLGGRKSTETTIEKTNKTVTPSRRASTGTVDASKVPDRGFFQSPRDAETPAFDPFSESSEDLFNSSAPTLDNVNKGVKNSKSETQKPPAVANLLDAFEEPVPTSSHVTGFDNFDHPPKNKSETSNAFADFPADFNASFATSGSFTSVNATKASAFSSDDFFSPGINQNHSFTSQPKTPPQSNTGFAPFPSAAFDAFSQPTTTNKPARRSSAQEIVQDFAGLTMESITATTKEVKAPSPTVDLRPKTPEKMESVEPPKASPDVWATNLVNLDLTPHGAKAAAPDRPLRSSITSPPLNASNPVMKPPPAIGGPPTAAAPMQNNGLNGMNPFPPGPLPAPAPAQPMSRGSIGPTSAPPINPFGNIPSSGNQRGSIRSSNPLDPFQTLPGLANPSFQPSAEASSSAITPPLSAGISTSGPFQPSGMNNAMSNNAMKSAVLSGAQKPSASNSSLDSLDWRLK